MSKRVSSGLSAAVLLLAVLVGGYWLIADEGPGTSRGGRPEDGQSAGEPVPDPAAQSLGDDPRDFAPPVDDRQPVGSRLDPPADTPNLVRVLVVDTDDQPIQGASLDLLTASGTEHLGGTGAGGEALIPATALIPGADLVASASGYATAFLELEPVTRGLLTLVLGDGGRLEGMVELATGGRAGAGVLVTAIPHEVFHAWDPASRAARRCSGARSAVTDDNGQFLLEGLDEGALYRLEATSDTGSALSGAASGRVISSSSGIVLTLFELRGVLLEFVCDDQAWMETCFRKPSLKTSLPSHLRQVPGPARGLSLARIPDLSGCSYCWPLFYAATRGDGGLPVGATVEGTIPGFEPFRVEVLLQPANEGRFPRHPVPLIRSAEGIGAVQVVLTGAGAEAVSQRGASGHLILRGGSGRSEFPMEWIPGQSMAVAQTVPSGTYRWEVSLEAGWVRSPGKDEDPESVAEFTLEPGGIQALEVAIPPVGYLELECHDMSGAIPCVVELTAFRGSAASSLIDWIRGIVCRSTPEWIGPLPPGRYSVRLIEPAPLPEGPHEFELQAGSVHTEVIVIR